MKKFLKLEEPKKGLHIVGDVIGNVSNKEKLKENIKRKVKLR